MRANRGIILPDELSPIITVLLRARNPCKTPHFYTAVPREIRNISSSVVKYFMSEYRAND